MSISSTQEHLLTSAYAAVRRTGLLSTAPGRWLFLRTYFLYKRYAEDNLQALLDRYPALGRGGNLIDAGANLGYTASVLAKAADPGRIVYAFEPEPGNVSMLRSIAARPATAGKIVPVASALGAETGTASLWLNERHHADHRVLTDRFQPASGERLTVPVITLDAFLREHPGPVAFVKIDVQGFELPVCQGMVELLVRNPAASVVLEYMPSAMEALGFAPKDVLEFFHSRGFACFTVHRNGHLERGVPALSARRQYTDLLFRRDPVQPQEAR